MITITQVSKYFVVDIGDSRIYMLNEKALAHFLKHQVKLSRRVTDAVIKTFAYQASVTIDLDKVG